MRENIEIKQSTALPPLLSFQVLKNSFFKSWDFRYNLRNNTNYFQVCHFVQTCKNHRLSKIPFIRLFKGCWTELNTEYWSVQHLEFLYQSPCEAGNKIHFRNDMAFIYTVSHVTSITITITMSVLGSIFCVLKVF